MFFTFRHHCEYLLQLLMDSKSQSFVCNPICCGCCISFWTTLYFRAEAKRIWKRHITPIFTWLLWYQKNHNQTMNKPIVVHLKESNGKKSKLLMSLRLLSFIQFNFLIYVLNKSSKVFKWDLCAVAFRTPNFAHSLKIPCSRIPSKTYHNLKWIRPFPE